MTAHLPNDRDDIDPAHAAAGTSPHSAGRQDVARHVDIERIETVPMTDEEYEDAVSALAELVLQWEKKGVPNTAPKKAA
ncbi:hypothetical protein [Frankia sp. CiP3]|uniref:hypothetical protein n=1 Tax=Frankia sp. CiP3 TaxID=2880971 RepID=UPI001EF3EFD2|nr:hypothetical protein [Frankia sp. CiP3]